MAEGVGRGAGGIVGLARLLTEHREAIEYDLIALGLRLDWLGTEALSWRDLLVILRQSPRTSAFRRAADETAPQTYDLELLRAIELGLRTVLWAKTEDAHRGLNRPKMLRFPWESEPPAADGSDVMTTEQAAARLGWDGEGCRG